LASNNSCPPPSQLTTELYLHIADARLQADYEAAMREVSRRLPLTGGAP
jgi:hypothetical protein